MIFFKNRSKNRPQKHINEYFFEYRQYGSLSGILATESDYYIINDGFNCYLIEVYTLKCMIKILLDSNIFLNKKTHHTQKLNGQIIKDNNNISYITKGFLIPKDSIINESIFKNEYK